MIKVRRSDLLLPPLLLMAQGTRADSRQKADKKNLPTACSTAQQASHLLADRNLQRVSVCEDWSYRS